MTTADAVVSRAMHLLSQTTDASQLAGIMGAIKVNARRYEKLLRGLASTENRRGQTYHILQSYTAKLCCLIAAWPRYETAPNWQELTDLARNTNPRVDCGEPIRAKFIKKQNGGYRPVCNFGPQRRMLQLLVRDILQASFGLSPYEYACVIFPRKSGRG